MHSGQFFIFCLVTVISVIGFTWALTDTEELGKPVPPVTSRQRERSFPEKSASPVTSTRRTKSSPEVSHVGKEDKQQPKKSTKTEEHASESQREAVKGAIESREAAEREASEGELKKVESAPSVGKKVEAEGSSAMAQKQSESHFKRQKTPPQTSQADHPTPSNATINKDQQQSPVHPPPPPPPPLPPHVSGATNQSASMATVNQRDKGHSSEADIPQNKSAKGGTATRPNAKDHPPTSEDDTCSSGESTDECCSDSD